MDMKALNCLLDLHIHLDGSISVQNARNLAHLQDITISESDQDLLRRMQVSDHCKDLNEYLEKFEFPLTLLQTPEALSESIRCLLEEQQQQGIIYTEIRFAPQLHMQKGLSQREVVDAVLKGMHQVTTRDKSGIQAGLILCCMRGSDNTKSNLETIRVASDTLNQGVVAVDLAGAEGLFPTEQFESLFELARIRQVPFTIHAGEADGPESVRRAIAFGATRIGHGVRSLEDPELVSLLKKTGIALELCPTSNLDTKIFSDILEYPVPQLLDAGIRITVNTDNMTVSNTTVRRELTLLQNTFHLSDQTIIDILYNAVDAAFTSEHTKRLIRQKILDNTNEVLSND